MAADPDDVFHHALACAFLAQYPLTETGLIFLRHNENLTYRVIEEGSGRKFLLRIHLPRLEGFRGIQQNRLAIESELAWLAALSRDTDLLLQQPQRNRDGEYVTEVAHPTTAETIHCTLLSWLDGRDFRQDDPQAETYACKLGELNARLHAHAQVWTPPSPFVRPAYDRPELQTALAQLKRGIGAGVFKKDDYTAAAEAGAYILDLLRTVERASHTWGLVHADLLGNLLVCGSRLAPIDFSLSGFGYYLFDMGICLCNLKKPFRQPYLKGYGRKLTAQEVHYTEAFILMIILISAARQVHNPEWKEWFGRRFPRIARDYCPMLLKGETFLYDI